MTSINHVTQALDMTLAAMLRQQAAGNLLCRCDQCGETFDESAIEERRILAGRRMHPDEDGPDEFVEICPSCGEEECIEHGISRDDEDESFQSTENHEPIV